jgi:hypothetical protein
VKGEIKGWDQWKKKNHDRQPDHGSGSRGDIYRLHPRNHLKGQLCRGKMKQRRLIEDWKVVACSVSHISYQVSTTSHIFS